MWLGENGTRYLVFDITKETAEDTQIHFVFQGTEREIYKDDAPSKDVYFYEYIEKKNASKTEENAQTESHKDNETNTIKNDITINNSNNTNNSSTQNIKASSNNKTNNTTTTKTNTNKTNNKEKTNSNNSKTTTSTTNKSNVTVNNNNSDMVWVGKTGNKYHRQSCRTLKGKGHQITLQQALKEGRQACKVCH
ncbi:MAG: hypothetical protein HFJ48_06010 [Clostridia bacterium]|nr:hypothetical protein [Clostridia bacterium]